MKISTKGRYALRTMIDLAQNSSGSYVRLKDISVRQGITIKYLEQIMPFLIRARLVDSLRGNNGGYRIALPPDKITVGDILRAAEGKLAPVSCLDDSPNLCPRSSSCPTLSFWTGLMQTVNEYCDRYKLSDLLDQTGFAEGI